jgi:hypothetical protein
MRHKGIDLLVVLAASIFVLALFGGASMSGQPSVDSQLPPIFRPGAVVTGGGIRYRILEVGGGWVRAIVRSEEVRPQEGWMYPVSRDALWAEIK